MDYGMCRSIHNDIKQPNYETEVLNATSCFKNNENYVINI